MPALHACRDAVASFDRALVGQALRFGFVGTATALLFVALIYFLSLYNLNSYLSTSISYLLAITFQYVGHSTFTFRKGLFIPRQIFRFLLANVGGWALSVLFVDIAAPLLDIASWPAALAVVVVLPVFNFIVFRLWAFVTPANSADKAK